MISNDTFSQMALSLPEVVEQDHHGIPSYRIKGKIFTTLWAADQRAMVKLPLAEQSIFCNYKELVFYPVPNAWGAKGATFVDLKNVEMSLLMDALRIAYCAVAPPKLAAMVRHEAGMD